MNKNPRSVSTDSDGKGVGKMKEFRSDVNQTKADCSQNDCACSNQRIDKQLQISTVARYLTTCSLPSKI